MVSNIGIGQFSNNSFESLLSTNAATNSTFVSNDYDFVSQTFRNSSESLELYYFYRTEQLTFLWILFFMIVFGNSSVLITLILSKNRKSRMAYFIMHLSLADLLVGLISVLTDIVWRMTIGFYMGNIACKIIKFLQVLVTYSSTYVLVSLSIDRYDAITHPLNFSGSWSRARLLVASAWGISAIFSIPAIFLNEEAYIGGHPQCWIHLRPWQWQVYITLVALSLFFFPAVIISACYSIIVHTIWTKSKPISKSHKSTLHYSPKNEIINHCSNEDREKYSTKFANNCIGDSADADFKRSAARGVIPKAKIKTVKMTFVIVFMFIICWSPYFVWDLLQVYGYIPSNQTTLAVSTFIQSLAPLNSAANPIIYCLFSTQVCKNLRKSYFCHWIVSRLCCRFPSLQRPLRSSTTTRSDQPTATSSLTKSSARTHQAQMIPMTSRSKVTHSFIHHQYAATENVVSKSSHNHSSTNSCV